MYAFSPDLSFAHKLDEADPLQSFRKHFVISTPDLIYLDGNSLGRLPYATVERTREIVEKEWGERLIRSWNEGWLDLPLKVGDKVGQLLGARPGEVLIADSTSVNLFKLMTAALRHQEGRSVILTDDLNFPSDLYVIEGVIDLLGSKHELRIIPSEDGIHGPLERIIDSLNDEVAVVSLSYTVFKSGFTYPMEKLTRLAREKGILVLWDLSHSVGSVPIDLHGSQVDLAVGCTYKYLNGGPGAPAFLYVRKELQRDLHNPISGWMGHQNMFQFSHTYEPADGIRKFLTGTPSVIATSLVETGVDLLLEAGMENIRQKSVLMGQYFHDLWRYYLEELGFVFNSPLDAADRGSHISIGHPAALGIDLALIHDLQLIPDFRAPDNIRLGFVPLYTSYAEVFEAVQRIKTVVEQKLYKKYEAVNPVVT